MRHLFFLLITCLLLLPQNAAATGSSGLLLGESTSEVSLGRSLQLLEDPTGKLSLLQVMQDRDWTPSTSDEPNLGFTRSVWWARTSVTFARFDQRTWYLQINDALLNHVDVYFVLPGNEVIHKQGGGATAMHQRDIHYRTHVFELPAHDSKQEVTVDIYLRISSELAIIIPARIFDAKAFAGINTQETWAYSLYFGFMSAMFFFNLTVWAIMRDPANLLYCGFSFGVMMLSAIFSGFGKQFIWPASPSADNAIFNHSVAWTAVFANMFSARFLGDGSPSREPFHTQRLYLVYGVSAASFLATTLGFIQWGIQLAVINCVYGILNILFSSVYGIVHKNRNAMIFFVAWAGFIAGVIIFSFRGFGILPSNLFTTNIVQIASVFECFLLMVALIEKSRQHREEAEMATARAMVQLEDKVSQRTAELAQAQEKLVQQEKMAALGIFTAGMAHEINNPANFVSAGVQNAEVITGRFERFVADLLDDDADPGIAREFNEHFQKLHSQHELIHTGIDRITKIIARLRTHHPEGETGMMPVDISLLLDSTWSLISSQLKTAVHFSCDTNGDPTISGRAAELQQALLAIFSNAVLAMEERQLGENDPRPALLRCWIECSEVEDMRLSIDDNGIGIPARHLGKVFDPFFTTREVGKGIGLGLTTTRDIIERHGGRISLDSTEGKGTRVMITLPLVPVNAAA